MATDIIIPMLLFLSHAVVFALGFGAGRHLGSFNRERR
jgi:hypothetical protein